SLLTSIAGVEAVDAQTVKILLKGGGAELPSALATGAGAIINPKVLADSSVDIATAPPANAGSGPYILDEFQPGVSVSYTRSDDAYWDPAAANYASMEFRVAAGTAVQN